MKTLKITKKDLDKDNFYKKDSVDFDGHVEISESLGYVRFKKSVVLTGSLIVKAGSGIEAGWGIKAGWGIEAGWGIKAGSGIEAGWGIEAGDSIKAGEGIKAGSGIEAGEGIEAGSGIMTLFNSITAKFIICLRVVVGFHSEEEQTIKAEIRKGKVILGKVEKVDTK